MSVTRVILLDTNAKLTSEWKRQLWQIPFITKLQIDTFEGQLNEINSISSFNTTAVLSPANSIGGMSGGFDKSLREIFKIGQDFSVESYIRNSLKYGYTPIGTSHVVNFDNQPDFGESMAWKKLRATSIIVTPTMRVPQKIYNGDNQGGNFIKKDIVKFVFDCVWESLCAVTRHNEAIKNGSKFTTLIDTIIMPGIGTGYGGVPLELAAKAMIGALSLWEISTPLNVGLLCLIFLGEDYRVFDNKDVMECLDSLVVKKSYNVLTQDL